MGERLNGIEEVRGSSPLSSTTVFLVILRSEATKPALSGAEGNLTLADERFFAPGGLSE